MKLVDTVKRDKTEVDSIVRRIKVILKKGSTTWGRDFSCTNVGRVYTIQADNDGMLASDMAYIVRHRPNAVMIEEIEYTGSYDWASDTYIRPVSAVTFRMM